MVATFLEILENPWNFMKIEFSLKFRENWTNILEISKCPWNFKNILEIKKMVLTISLVQKQPKIQNFRLWHANNLILCKNSKNNRARSARPSARFKKCPWNWKKKEIVDPKTQNFRLRRANCLDLYKNQKIFTLDVLDQAPEQYIEDKIVKNSVENYKMTSKIAISDTKHPWNFGDHPWNFLKNILESLKDRPEKKWLPCI